MASANADGMASEEPQNSRPSKRVKFSSQVQVAEYHAVPAKDTVTFHLLWSTTSQDVSNEILAGGMQFKCEFYNQVFGDSEEINGYKGLTIDIWLAVNSYHCWVDIRYDAKRPGADDVLALLQAWWPSPFTTDKAEFINRVTAAPALDFSQGLGDSISTVSGLLRNREYVLRLYHAKMVDTPEWFKELHRRIEPLLIFTIDGANFLDVADPKWEVVPAVLEMEGKQQLVGYMMVYNFYAWPLSQRPRVAQILVLPPLQGAGFGKEMIKAAYKLAQQREAVDLTFEDPATGLQRLREKLELEMMRGQPWLVEAAYTALAAAKAEELKQQAAAQALFESATAKQQQQHQQQVVADSGGQPDQRQVAAAADAGLKQTTTVADQEQKPPKSPAALLAMPQALQQRVTRELKIHKHQVYSVWEALLFLQAPLDADNKAQSNHPLQEPLQEFVLERLESTNAAVSDKNAGNKRLVEVPGKSDDWFVYKVSSKRQPTVGSPSEALMSDTVNVGRHTITEMSAEDWSERLQQLTGDRVEQLMELRWRMLKGCSKVL